MNTIMLAHYIAAAYLAVALLARLTVFRPWGRADRADAWQLSFIWFWSLPIALYIVVSDAWSAWRWERRLAQKARKISRLIDAALEEH